MQDANAPTPGTNSASQFIASSKSAEIDTVAPVVSSARWADRTFPDP
jgi:hypothetical protein